MSKLEILTGIPASGKTTYRNDKVKNNNNYTYVSSDEVREEMYGSDYQNCNNEKVFNEVHNRIQNYLGEGYNVIFDATNTSRKKRQHLINHVIKADEYEAVYFSRKYQECVYVDKTRKNTVGQEVIKKMYKNLEIPMEGEGFDKVTYKIVGKKPFFDYLNEEQYPEFTNRLIKTSLRDDNHTSLIRKVSGVFGELQSIYNFPQDNPYHSFSVSLHTFYVIKYLQQHYASESDSDYMQLMYTALLHDIGKPFCKSFINYKGEEKRYASFLGHESVGAQYACDTMLHLGYSEEFVKSVVNLIQLHMMPMKDSVKVNRKLMKWLGEDEYEKLMLFHEADVSAK